MNAKFTERTQVKRPAALPVDLDNGRMDIPRVVAQSSFAAVTLVCAVIGLWIMVRGFAGVYVNWFLVILGVGFAVIAVVLCGVTLYVAVTEWLDHRKRVSDWHYLAIQLYETDGLETIEQTSEWSFTADNPAHVLLCALSVQLAVHDSDDALWSCRSLRGPCFLAGRRIGELSAQSAERMSRRFAELGLVQGRGERSAGEWAARSADEILQLVVKNW